jgi:hypothetical protein
LLGVARLFRLALEGVNGDAIGRRVCLFARFLSIVTESGEDGSSPRDEILAVAHAGILSSRASTLKHFSTFHGKPSTTAAAERSTWNAP